MSLPLHLSLLSNHTHTHRHSLNRHTLILHQGCAGCAGEGGRGKGETLDNFKDRIVKLADRNKKKGSRIRTSTELGRGAPGMHSYLSMHKYDERRETSIDARRDEKRRDKKRHVFVCAACCVVCGVVCVV